MKIDVNTIKRLFSQSLSGFRSTPLPCRICYIFLLFGFFLVLIGRQLGSSVSIVNALTVVPFRLLPPNFWIWTLATFWFIETNFVLLICHFICIHISGAVLFTLWGWREWSRYFVLTNIIAALITVAVSSAIYLLTNSEPWYFDTPSSPHNVRGLAAFDGAIFVAIKQALPDTVIFNTPWFGRYKNSHFPFTAIIIGVIVTALRLLSPAYLMQFIFGSYVGWIYLRFYQKHPNAGSPLGDPSDNFTFASFFPSIMQPPISFVSDACYRLSVRLKLCKPAVRRFVDMGGLGGSLQSVVTPSTISTNQADAERRRQKALRDLNERLAKAKEQSAHGLAWPSLVDDDDGGPDEQRKQTQPTTHQSSLADVVKGDGQGPDPLLSVSVNAPSPSSTHSSKTVKEQNLLMEDL